MFSNIKNMVIPKVTKEHISMTIIMEMKNVNSLFYMCILINIFIIDVKEVCLCLTGSDSL